MAVKKLKDYPDLLTVQDAMELLRIGRKSVYALIDAKRLPSKKIAGKYRIPKRGVTAYLNAKEPDMCYNNDCDGSDALQNEKECNQ